ncbi:MAG: hydroxymethylglutaryl-CoA lyase [Firmicutes bacterium]|nr:hydroxymethylglutaryl-CoA lyase [Bacillota bacterium]
MRWPDSVTIVEVGPRDGLQDQQVILPTEAKLRFIQLLAAAGFRRIEATSFTHPKWIPPLADADALAAGLGAIHGPAGAITWSALIPNQRGYDRAHAAGIHEVTLVVSASESHNKANINRSVAESLAGFREITQHARRDGIRVRGAIATAFGCPFEGAVPPQQVIAIARAYGEMGVDELCLADTIGSGQPRQVFELFEAAAAACPQIPLAAHFHDRRGYGLPNVLAALAAGATVFDSSVGGLGGCPYAPGAPGNISTRAIVAFMADMGVKTGIDLDGVAAAEHQVLQMLRETATPH